jgi:hypothetical protein
MEVMLWIEKKILKIFWVKGAGSEALEASFPKS